MNKRIVDMQSNLQVLGNLLLNPSLLDQPEYNIIKEDFTEDLHRVIFAAVTNLYKLGNKEITAPLINDYLRDKTKAYIVFKSCNGINWVKQTLEIVQSNGFNYYYKRMKKFTLLRMYNDIGLDISNFYDADNAFDLKKKQKQDEWLDNTDVETIADLIDKKISSIKLKYANVSESDFFDGGDGIVELIESFKSTPDVGMPLYGDIINTVTRGARLGKFYLRSMPTNTGKSRMMVADVCNFGCDEIYNIETGRWEKNGVKVETLFIITEQKKDEVQTAMLAFLSGVNEEKIRLYSYNEDELQRIYHAAELIKNSKIHIKELPDFSMQDIENAIKYSIHEWGVQYVLFDYLHSSLKILSEVSSKARVSNLREDNILFMISTRLKDLCTQYDIFILTSTQLNGGYQDATVYDQNLLRGAKSIADKTDIGMIGLSTTEKDHETLQNLTVQLGVPMPNIKISIYKNRGGRWKDIILWCNADKGICRYNPIFVTDYNYELIPIVDLKIDVEDLNNA